VGRRLLHAWRRGIAKHEALLDDYAFLIHGLLELDAATGDAAWRDAALMLQTEQDERLWDAEHGGYFGAGETADLLVRVKSAHDGPSYSGAGIAALNLLRLAEWSGDERHARRADELLLAHGGAMAELPLGHVTLVLATRRRGRVEGAGAAFGGEPYPAAATLRVEPGAEGGWRPFEVRVEVRAGWHVQANPAGESSLVATALEPGPGSELRSVVYPEPGTLAVGFAERPLPVLGGSFSIRGELRGPERPELRLVCQACDETRCLPPQALAIRVAGTGAA
jgi:hypothetical protein